MKQYEIILADAPWAYANWTDRRNGAAVSAYPVLNDNAIIELPVDRIAAPDSLLFMWATFPKLETALQAMRSWGFTYVCTPIVWVKTNKDGSPYHGIGFWAVGGAEIVLMGRRGKGLPRNPETRGKVKQVLTSPRMAHSAKPPEARERIIQLVGDVPRIELFARERAEGWDATGLDLDGIEIQDFLEE